jgi:gliding motility-associated-like protein
MVSLPFDKTAVPSYGCFRRSIPFLFLFFSVFDSHAQLCEGSLGDPIVNIDFGSGSSTHGQALPSGTTSYTYSTADFPIDGSYTIENSTAGSGSSWWSTTDHTGNSGGYMMVVNASLSLTDYFYKNTITGLCPGTLYEFASWVMNLLRSQDLSPPNITFLIQQTDGTLISSYTTGSIALQSGPHWRQFGFNFTTPPNVSTVVMVMRNNSAGGAPANDIALDDITFRPCGPDVTALIAETSTISDTFCIGTGVILHLQGTVSAGFSDVRFQWQEMINGVWQDIAGANAILFPVSLLNYPAGTHLFRLAVGDGDNIASAQCRIISNSISLSIAPNPVVNFGIVSPAICTNLPVQFIDSSDISGSVFWQWDFGDGGASTEQNPQHRYTQSGTYSTSLIVTTPEGCSDTAARELSIVLLDLPEAAISVVPENTSIYEPTITASDESIGAVTCSIDWGDGTVTDCSQNQHDYAVAGSYTIRQIVSNSNGCYDTAFVDVIIRAEFNFHIPNAFTPNGDGLNDLFKPVLLGVHEYVFRIFNRWGEQLFETRDPSEGWDGRVNGSPAPAESYVYSITFREDVDQTQKSYAGWFILLY